jgi:putative redox protein
MKEELVARWANGMSFTSTINDHEITIDAHPKVGGEGKGPRPKPLLLFSLAGCTGMDVVSLLKKMRVDYSDLKIKIDAELTEEHPKYYSKIHITYLFSGKDIDKGKVEKAVNLSQDKYCGVSHMLKQASEITWEIIINENH